MSTVGMLLKKFPEKGVIQISPTNTVVDAVKVMKGKNISSLLIVDKEGSFVGILSERDISWKIVLENLNPAQVTVGEIMTSRDIIETVTELTTLTECLDLMRQKNVRHLPVLQNGVLIGVISIKDVAKHYELLVDDLNHYIKGYR